MLNLMKVKLGLMTTCLVVAGAYGCGTEDDAKDGNNGGAKSDTSSFSVDVSGNSGSSKVKAEQKDDQAGKSSWGATISGDTLMILLVDPNGTTVTAIVKTSESAKAPGTFTVGGEFDDINVTMLNPTAGNVFKSIGEGTIKLDNCPRAMGEHIKGSFTNIKLQSELGGNVAETINGSFDIVVYAKSGDLFCYMKVAYTTTGESVAGGNTTPTCQADMCDDGGTCCPYMECMATCEYKCFTDHCMMNPGSAECFSCTAGCLDSCNVSSECRSEMGKLMTCEEKAGCDEIEDEDKAMECSKTHCCSELNAVY